MSGRHSITETAEQSFDHVLPDSVNRDPSYREIMRRTRQPLPELFETVASTNRAANRWLIQKRWSDGPRCAHCGSTEVTEETPEDEDAEIRFQCASCGKGFGVRTNHFTANPPGVSLRHWVLALHLMLSEPQFWSEEQIARFLGLDQQTTYLVVHAIHMQMMESDPSPLESLARVFEVDEACWPKHLESAAGERFTHRLYTVVVLERATGQVRVWVVSERTKSNLVAILRRSGVRRGCTLYSDGWVGYEGVGQELIIKHCWVNHGAYEFVNMDDPDNHINGAESYFAWTRRALSRIEISQENLTRYAAQAEFMFNRRQVPVIERMGELASREHGSLTPERIAAEQSRFAPPTPTMFQPEIPIQPL